MDPSPVQFSLLFDFCLLKKFFFSNRDHIIEASSGPWYFSAALQRYFLPWGSYPRILRYGSEGEELWVLVGIFQKRSKEKKGEKRKTGIYFFKSLPAADLCFIADFVFLSMDALGAFFSLLAIGMYIHASTCK